MNDINRAELRRLESLYQEGYGDISKLVVGLRAQVDAAKLKAKKDRAALREAEQEAGDVSERLSHFLCEVTGSMLSYSTYPVSTMIQHTEEYFDRLAKENHDDYCEKSEQLEEERDAALERAEAAEATLERVREVAYRHRSVEQHNEMVPITDIWSLIGEPSSGEYLAALAPVTEEGDKE